MRRVQLVFLMLIVCTLATAPGASALSRDNGASFAVRCDFSHRAPDDPIVHPGMSGMAHSHDFFGNRTTDAHSTHESLLGGATTCTRPEDTAAYWIPTVKWNGQDLQPNRAVFYYRAGGKDHTQVRAFPAGLKVVPDTRIRWMCGRPDKGKGSKTPPTQCDTGELGVRVIFPDCSNGQLDSDDHRSHMTYSKRRDGTRQCPQSHPTPVPTLTMNVSFPIPQSMGEVTLASGEASSMHADFFNAWDQQTLDALVKHCINDVPPSEPRPEECRAPRRA